MDLGSWGKHLPEESWWARRELGTVEGLEHREVWEVSNIMARSAKFTNLWVPAVGYLLGKNFCEEGLAGLDRTWN